MMDPKKQQLIAELIAHLEDSQGGELARLMEEHSKPKSTDGLGLAGEDPKGLSVEKVSVLPGEGSPDEEAKESPEMEAAEAPDDMGAPKEGEPSDDELLELLKQYSGSGS